MVDESTGELKPISEVEYQEQLKKGNSKVIRVGERMEVAESILEVYEIGRNKISLKLLGRRSEWPLGIGSRIKWRDMIFVITRMKKNRVFCSLQKSGVA